MRTKNVPETYQFLNPNNIDNITFDHRTSDPYNLFCRHLADSLRAGYPQKNPFVLLASSRQQLRAGCPQNRTATTLRAIVFGTHFLSIIVFKNFFKKSQN